MRYFLNMFPTTLRILSYNIHKGFDFFGQSQLVILKKTLEAINVDIILFQEVVGQLNETQKKRHNGVTKDQWEYFADSLWSYSQYGKNAIYPNSHHGNLILSKYPLQEWVNFDISETWKESRGLLMARVDLPSGGSFWICNTHLSLFHRHRLKQLQKIKWHLQMIPEKTPLILGGDFNDWNKKLTPLLRNQMDLEESYQFTHGKEAKTFPSFFPLLSLDRLYSRHCFIKKAQVLDQDFWRSYSDHLPLLIELEVPHFES